MSLARRAPVALVAFTLAACAGQPFAAPIEDEPLCTDFELGASHDKMEGSLKFPVQVRFLEGKTQLQRVVLHGRRNKDGKPPKSFLPDDDSEITVEWAQCSNEWAPRPATVHAPSAHERESDNKYDCGEPTVYATEKLVIKKHDAASHLVHFVPAKEKSGCWTTEAPPAPPPPPAPSALPSAEPAASAEPVAASAEPSAAPSAKPSAAPSASAAVRAEPPPKPTK